MARVLIMWSDPMHISRDEAESWLREHSTRLLALDGIDRIELTRLAQASDRHAKPCDWLLEVHLAAGSDPAESIDDPLLSDWLGDLQLLGMRPVVLLTATTVPLVTMDR